MNMAEVTDEERQRVWAFCDKLAQKGERLTVPKIIKACDIKHITLGQIFRDAGVPLPGHGSGKPKRERRAKTKLSQDPKPADRYLDKAPKGFGEISRASLLEMLEKYFVAKHQGERLTQAEIAESLNISMPAVKKVYKALGLHGLHKEYVPAPQRPDTGYRMRKIERKKTIIKLFEQYETKYARAAKCIGVIEVLAKAAKATALEVIQILQNNGTGFENGHVLRVNLEQLEKAVSLYDSWGKEHAKSIYEMAYGARLSPSALEEVLDLAGRSSKPWLKVESTAIGTEPANLLAVEKHTKQTALIDFVVLGRDMPRSRLSPPAKKNEETHGKSVRKI